MYYPAINNNWQFQFKLLFCFSGCIPALGLTLVWIQALVLIMLILSSSLFLPPLPPSLPPSLLPPSLLPPFLLLSTSVDDNIYSLFNTGLTPPRLPSPVSYCGIWDGPAPNSASNLSFIQCWTHSSQFTKP